MAREVSFGPVAVRQPGAGLRIGHYDDDDSNEDGEDVAIVYFCEPPFLFSTKYELVDYDDMSPIDTDSLWQRREELRRQMASRRMAASRSERPGFTKLYEYAIELNLVGDLLADRLIDARFREGKPEGKRVFISHSSLDKQEAMWLSVDLANEGHLPWLDEWEIKAGESIPKKIALGVDASDFLLVLLSDNSVSSGWVEAEWSSKYWSEIQEGRTSVIPVLLSDCEVPTLLRTKKYADLRRDYGRGLEQVLEAIRS